MTMQIHYCEAPPSPASQVSPLLFCCVMWGDLLRPQKADGKVIIPPWFFLHFSSQQHSTCVFFLSSPPQLCPSLPFYKKLLLKVQIACSLPYMFLGSSEGGRWSSPPLSLLLGSVLFHPKAALSPISLAIILVFVKIFIPPSLQNRLRTLYNIKSIC